MSRLEKRKMMQKQEMPLVSLIILTYRNFHQIEKTLHTILMQDYPNKEVIISDDGSETFLDIAEQEQIRLLCKSKNTPVLILQNAHNLGIVQHSNAAAKRCKGQYIKFLPPGDGFLDKGSLSRMVAFALEQDTQIVTSPSYVCKGSFQNICYEYPSKRKCKALRNARPEKLFRKIAAKNFISAIGTMYRKDFFENGGYDCKYRHLDDWPTWLQQYRAGRRIPCMERPTVLYMLGGISSSGGNAFDSELLRDDLRTCYEKEILPYKKRMSMLSRWMIGYYYSLLTAEKTLGFYIIYSPLWLWDLMKKIIKKKIF